MPIPFGTLFFAWSTLMAVLPIRRPRPLALLSWICSAGPNELPLTFLFIVIASSLPTAADGGLDSSADWSSIAVTILMSAGLVVVTGRALRATASTRGALAEGLGPQWRSQIEGSLADRLRRRRPWLRILLMPWPFRPSSVERLADIAYGERGRSNLLDVYRHRSHPSDSPTLIYLHGGRFRSGRKNKEARPLLHRLASQGWTCISANYHLSPTPAQGFPEHLIDVKRVIAWARTHGVEHGVDPGAIFLAGSSAGAHLAAMAALTANDPRFQPGFEASDTSITAGIGLYGYYGALGPDAGLPSTPLAYDVGPGTAPFLVVHGDHDTYTPVAGARLLVEHLRSGSRAPVVYAELPGAQHSFDLFHSIRFEAVVDAVEAFAAWLRTEHADGRPGRLPLPRWAAP